MTTAIAPDFKLHRLDLWQRFAIARTNPRALGAVDALGLAEEFGTDADGRGAVALWFGPDRSGELTWKAAVEWNGAVVVVPVETRGDASPLEALRVAVGRFLVWHSAATRGIPRG